MTATSAAHANSLAAPRTLINIGVFTALYFLFTFAGGMLGIFHPAMMLVGGVVSCVLNGIVCMLMVAKTRVLGAYTIMGGVVGILMVATGHFWATVIIAAALGAVADVVTRLGNYTRTTTNALAFALFTLWSISPMLPLFLNSGAYLADIGSQMGAEYAATFGRVFTVPVVVAWLGISFVMAFGAAVLGMKLLRRHFERAGVA